MWKNEESLCNVKYALLPLISTHLVTFCYWLASELIDRKSGSIIIKHKITISLGHLASQNSLFYCIGFFCIGREGREGKGKRDAERESFFLSLFDAYMAHTLFPCYLLLFYFILSNFLGFLIVDAYGPDTCSLREIFNRDDEDLEEYIIYFYLFVCSSWSIGLSEYACVSVDLSLSVCVRLYVTKEGM
ncbi:hypothetical protein EYC80_005673 [Monilinia laxa]|uniref:Uncharacterized protein n=1 Tax=Monilinia laxa TaxID=61186 RepID=A0A5N6KFZ8_MONLA|nr:hypothetical protein EYC80_005673 [Monilinia laxa]